LRIFLDFIRIVKFHGFYNGVKRFRDEIFENYFFDFFNKTQTRQIVIKKNYRKILQVNKKIKICLGDKWYQPTYSTPLIKSLNFLKKDILSYKNYEVCFIDIGCGKGKPNYIFSKHFPHIASYGIEIFNYYKNTFSGYNLTKILKKFMKLNIKTILIYNNPYFHTKILNFKYQYTKPQLIFKTSGWHKNYKSYIYSFEK
jgi:tRNA G46 methylase TrmB